MSTQRFDGADLEKVLAEVKAELGDDATILSAHKVRRGGVAGFFTRERFEVEAEPTPAEAVDEPAEPAAAAPTSILELADEVSDAEEHALEDEPSFASVLDRMARIEEEAKALTTGVAGADTSDIEPITYERLSPVVVPAPPAPAPTSPAMSMSLPIAVAAPIAAAAPSPAAVTGPVTAPPAAHLALTERGLPMEYVPHLPETVHLQAALAERLVALPPVPPTPEIKGAVIAVVGPRDVAVEVARDLAAELGQGSEQVVLASQSRYRSRGCPPVLLASAGEAADERRSWRRRNRPTVVAVDAAPGTTDQLWGREVLDALKPAVAWGVVDASRKTEDVAAFADAIGGIDALALHAVGTTVTPAAVLHLGIPVGRLDRKPASPALWAAVLTEGLVA